MVDEKLLGRITANPEIFGGKPIIRGMVTDWGSGLRFCDSPIEKLAVTASSSVNRRIEGLTPILVL